MIRYILSYRPTVRNFAMAFIILGLLTGVGLVLIFMDFAAIMVGFFPLILGLIGANAVIMIAKSNRIRCQSCGWVAGVADLRYHAGACPKCKGRYFMYPVYLTHDVKHRLLSGTTTTKYRLLIIKDKKLEDLTGEENDIMTNPPSRWWEAKPPDAK